jgi:integrase
MPDNSKNYTDPKISPETLDISVDWYVWFRYQDAVTGNWKQKRYKGGLNTYKSLRKRLPEAHALRDALAEQLKAGWRPDNVSQVTIHIYSIGQAFQFILNIKNQTLKPKSQSTYKHIVKLFTDWTTSKELTDTSLKHFTSKQAQDYMDHLLLEKKYSGRTFNDHLIILRTLFNCFVEREWIVKNPFRAVKKKTATIGRNHAYGEFEKLRLEQYLKANDIRLYYFTRFMEHSFIRRTEMTFLQVKHVDLLNSTITIPGDSAKNDHQESVVITLGLEPIIAAMELHRYSPEDYLFGRYLQTGPNRYKNPNGISTRHNKIVKALGIGSEKGLYSWKHTGVCKSYYTTGKDVYAIMRQLRHRDFNTTQIYLKSLGLIQNDVFRNSMVA